MANNYLGKNFGSFSDTENAEGIATKYLNLQGLTDFWAKIKDYVDTQDTTLFEAAKTKIGNVDSALRSYIESLTINSTLVSTNKTADTLGTSLTIEIGGEDIKVNHNGESAAEGEKYADGTTTVRGAFADVDNRLDAVEKAIGENIVNSISVTDTPSTEGTPNYVGFTMTPTGDPKLGTYNVALDVDETKLDTKIADIDDKITELEANAGVAGIRVVDTDSTESGEKHTNLVEVSLNAVKVNDKSDISTTVDGVEYYKSLVTLTVDETGLAQDLNEIDTTIATEVAHRKEDVENLAGDGYTVADGATTGVWNPEVKYKNITKLSERIAQIDKNLVTTINVVDTNANNDAEHPNWVAFSKADTAADGGDNSVTLTVDETKLGEYITKNEANLSALGGLTVNGHEVISVTPGSGDYAQVTVAHTDVVLSTADITRNTTAGAAGTKNLEEQLTEYDTKFAALASATHFRGKYDNLDAAVAAVKDQGDIVIVGLKEYVYYDPTKGDDFEDGYVASKTNFIELGDVEEEQTRIEQLEDWVDNNIIQEAEITAIFTANGTKPTFTF